MDASAAEIQRLRLLLDSTPDALVGIDANGCICEWNPQAERIFGWSREEALGRSLADTIVPPEQREAHRKGLERLRRTGESSVLNRRIELTALRRNGIEFPAELAVVPIGTQPLAFSAFVRDLTDQKRTEQALGAIFNQATVGIAQTDIGGRFVLVNQRFCDILARPRDEVLGLTLDDVTHPDDRTTHLAVLRRLAEAGPELGVEHRFVRPDRSTVWVSSSVSLLRDPAGRPRHVVAVVQDITARRQAEEERAALRNELALQLADMTRLHDLSVRLSSGLDLRPMLQDMLASVTAHLGCAMGSIELCDSERNELRVVADLGFSDDFLKALGRIRVGTGARGTAAAERRRVIVEDVDTDPILDSHRAVFSQSGCRALYVTPLLSRRGDLIGTLSFAFRKRQRPSDRQIRLAEVYARQAADFVESVRLVRELRDAIHARDEFISIASHELKTPLTALQLQIQHMRRNVERGGDAALGASLEKAERKGFQLAKLINELLDVSRLQAGKLQLELTETDLSDVLLGVIDRFKEEWPRIPPIELSGGANTRGVWDRSRIEQIVTNLLSNAIKYGCGGRVRVALAGGEGQVTLSVQDEGVGMTRELMARIFRPFERGVPHGPGGLGLGLYIVKQIVEAHGGTISVQSAPGEGSLFTVALPRTPPPRQTPRPGFLRAVQ